MRSDTLHACKEAGPPCARVGLDTSQAIVRHIPLQAVGRWFTPPAFNTAEPLVLFHIPFLQLMAQEEII